MSSLLLDLKACYETLNVVALPSLTLFASLKLNGFAPKDKAVNPKTVSFPE